MEDIKRRMDNETLNRVYFISEEDLEKFILSHFLKIRDMNPEGCATLISSFDHKRYLKIVSEINKKYKIIHFGKLVNGIFVENNY